jgi:beta-glucosidase
MMHKTKARTAFGLLFLAVMGTSPVLGTEAYKDPTQPVDKRVADLLGRMTPNEKVGQLRQIYAGKFRSGQLAQLLRTGQVGSLQNIPSNPALRNRMQRLAVEQSPHGIPLIFGFNSIHGYRTVFPIPLAMACAWEPALFEHTAEIAAREMAADGFDWTFAPMVDLARDPRWGRIAEGYGEDPWLSAQYAAASVRGFQGTDPAARDRVVACLKHYVGYGAAEGGRDYNTVELSDYTLRNFYLPPFRAGIAAGALTVMSAFHAHNGVPATGSRYLLTDVLRGELGFKGLVVSDWESVAELLRHGTVTDAAGAAQVSLHAGVDMEKVSATYTNIPQLLATERLTQAEVDEAVRRVLRVKFQWGLFEHPYVDETLAKAGFLQPDALALAREAAAKSCVLLKNNGVLPLSKDLKRVALIGPMGAEQGELLGCWPGRGEGKDVVSLAQGLRAALPTDVKLDVAKGCELVEASQSKRPSVVDEAAVALAREVDVIVLAVGEPSSWSGEEGCRAELGLSGRQMELFEKVSATGKPVVVLLFSGRPLAMPQVYARANAVLQVWQPGVQGGPALADLLLGKAAPSGRLPVSVPRGIGQVPLYYNHLNTGRPTMGLYKDMERGPQFPFGHGLTYTTFTYGPIKLDAARVSRDEKITATTIVKNTGKNPGEEVVQLYIRALASTDARPVRELKGFQKISLAPGESRTATFKLTTKDLGYYDAQGRWLVELGAYQVWIAPNSEAGQAVEVVLA